MTASSKTLLARQAVAEGVGTALLLSVVVGTGMMAEALGARGALALLICSLSTGAGLVALIMAFGPVSGAHLNPVVTLAVAFERGLPWRSVPAYLVAQVVGAFAGIAVAHVMFGRAVFSEATVMRAGAPIVFSEGVATFGLMSVVWACSRMQASVVPFAVGLYIMCAYWFTSSTSFANPAASLARAFTDSPAGIRLVDVPGFVTGELCGGALATLLFRWLVPSLPAASSDVVVPHPSRADDGP